MTEFEALFDKESKVDNYLERLDWLNQVQFLLLGLQLLVTVLIVLGGVVLLSR
jgi:hypothetical protein